MVNVTNPTGEGWVFPECPNCGWGLRISWPTDDREQIELRCSGCHQWLDITRDATVVGVKDERESTGPQE